MTLEIGDRVRLQPDPRWLSQWYPLAETGRVGTITGTGACGTMIVEFDVKRPGAKPKAGGFSPKDLLLVAKGPYQPLAQTPLLPSLLPTERNDHG